MQDSILQFMQSAVLSTPLHLLFLVVEPSAAMQARPNWFKMLRCVEGYAQEREDGLGPNARVCSTLGCDERFLSRMVRGAGPRPAKNQSLEAFFQSQRGVAHRLYVAMFMHAVVVEELPLRQVARSFDCEPGFIQATLRSCSIYCSAVAAFCQEIPVSCGGPPSSSIRSPYVGRLPLFFVWILATINCSNCPHASDRRACGRLRSW